MNIDSPMVGYSSIIIETTGEGRINAHGFAKAEVKQRKTMTLDRSNK